MSQNINSTTRHLKFACILIFTNPLWASNETKILSLYYIQQNQLKKIKRTRVVSKKYKNEKKNNKKTRCDKRFCG